MNDVWWGCAFLAFGSLVAVGIDSASHNVWTLLVAGTAALVGSYLLARHFDRTPL